ncbi:MAG: hypothetical protein V2A73_02505, partial [Pseudomonadota bacterium]
MSVTSRLSSLLVRDAVVDVKRMEQAFQRQVIYGGGLDTILLEMGLINESRLTNYLSLTAGIPPADKDLLDYVDPRAVQICPREIAEEYQVAPIGFEGPALKLLVTDPVDLGRLEGLATRIDTPIQPFVTPEFRFHAVLEQLLGIPVPPRFSSLAAKIAAAEAETQARAAQAQAESAAQLRQPKVQIPAETTLAVSSRSDETADADTRRRVVPADRPEPVGALATIVARPPAIPSEPAVSIATAAMTTDSALVVPPPTAQPAEPAQSALPGQPVLPAQPTSVDQTVPATRLAPPQLAPPAPSSPPPPPTPPPPTPPAAVPLAPVPAVTTAIEATGAVNASAVPATATATATSASRRPWQARITIGTTPLEPKEAIALLAKAEDRDSVFGTIVRCARSRASYAAVLTVQGKSAFGCVAIAGDESDSSAVCQVCIPLDRPSAFESVVSSASPYIGPIRTGIPELDKSIERMGGVLPPAALLLPIALRNRVVALVYVHRGAEPLSIAEAAELLPIAAEAAAAFSRLILRAKSQNARKPEEATPAMAAAAVATAVATEAATNAAVATGTAGAGVGIALGAGPLPDYPLIEHEHEHEDRRDGNCVSSEWHPDPGAAEATTPTATPAEAAATVLHADGSPGNDRAAGGRTSAKTQAYPAIAATHGRSSLISLATAPTVEMTAQPLPGDAGDEPLGGDQSPPLGTKNDLQTAAAAA